MKQPHIIAFATQKGGAGKSTITTHTASVLAYHYGYKVAVVDCDYPQNTLNAYRVEEQNRLEEPAFQARLLKQDVTPYPIIVTNMENVDACLDSLEENEYDFILVDTPGTVNVVGITELLARVDYIFLPLEPDKGTIASTMSYMGILEQFLNSNNADSQLKGYYAFWNKYVKSEKKGIYDKTEALFQEMKLPLLHSRVEQMIIYKDSRSTYFPLSEKDLGRLGFGALLMEILTLVLGEGAVTPSGHTLNLRVEEVAGATEATEVAAGE